jgi:pilus assembly protein Flp/PilA
MKSRVSFLVAFCRNQGGATAVEYAMVAFLIGVAIIGGATAFGQAVNSKFAKVSSSVSAIP